MKTDTSANTAYLDFQRFAKEIYLDSYDLLSQMKLLLVDKTIIQLGSNELHNMVKYYQKAILNALFFNDRKILYSYNEWLYRVYYHKNIDLDFFPILIDTLSNITNRYLSTSSTVIINDLLEFIKDNHHELMKIASKKKVLIDNEKDAVLLAKVLLDGDNKKAYEILYNNAQTLNEFINYYNEVISNTMKYVGYMWETSEISVAKEHIATATLNDILTKHLNGFKAYDDKDIHIFLSSAPHELHGLGTKIASSVFEKLGYKVTHIKASTSSKDIKRAIMEFSPDFVIFSATLQTSLLDVALLITELNKEKSAYTRPFKIGIAGNGFENIFHPTKTLNADFYMNKLEDIITYI